MIDEIRKNINTEIEMLREISSYSKRAKYAVGSERELLEQAIKSLKNSIKLINDSLPDLLNSLTVVKRLPGKSESGENKINLEKIVFKRASSDIDVTLSVQNREKFIKELSLSESAIKKLKKREIGGERFEEFKAASGYLKLSNKIFHGKSEDLINKGYFKPLALEIKRANIEILFETYVSMILFTTLISFFVGLFLMIFFLVFDFNFGFPLISIYSGNYLIRFGEVILIPIFLPIVVFLALYYYPGTEKSSLEKSINAELPFAVIHMIAIAGSGITPAEIFKIIGTGNEYPYLKKDIRKVLNQINLYGYDLVTALNNASKSTPSKKLAELFSGLGSTISSGIKLSDFFEKRAETLMTEYKIEREKYTKVAETFMDIYISVVIAAPMVLMLLLIMLSISGSGFGLSQNQLSFVIISIVALINILFLGFLHIRRPTY